MKLATTEDFTRFCPTITECLTHIADAGFRYVDLTQYVPRLFPELFEADNRKDNARHIKHGSSAR